MIAGWVTLATGHMEEAERLMQQIERVFGTTIEALAGPEAEELSPEALGALVEVATLRSQFSIAHFDLSRTIEQAQIILRFLSNPGLAPFYNSPADLRPAIVYTLGLAYELSGKLALAAQAFEQAAAESQAMGNTHLAPLALGHLGQVQLTQGRLHQAETSFQRTLENARQMSAVPSPFIGVALAGLGILSYE